VSRGGSGVAQLLLMFCNVHAFGVLEDSLAPCTLVLS
jgi:hypothetical protein